ncbi:MAG: hypothetical protein U0414_22750 [Polyangiaceae bacterium]
MEPRTGDPPSVVIVSRNAETIDALSKYLAGAGLRTEGGASVESLAREDAPTGWVLFPDDFPPEAVDASIERCPPTAVLILVTSSPKRFAIRMSGADRRRVVLAKPAWGWAILDAILERLDPREKEPTS